MNFLTFSDDDACRLAKDDVVDDEKDDRRFCIDISKSKNLSCSYAKNKKANSKRKIERTEAFQEFLAENLASFLKDFE